MDFLWLILIFGAIAALIIWASIYQEKQRRKFWWELANEWGFRYRPGDPYGFCDREELPLFQQGHARRVEHLIEGEVNGQKMMLFDYRYKTGSGKNESTFQLSALLFTTDIMGHRLTVRSENLFDRIGAFLGFEDINFEFEEFNRAFQVRCDDKKFAYDVFHSEMMEYYLPHRTVALEWSLNQMLFYQYPNDHFDKAKAQWMRQFAEGFVKRLPDYLREQQRGE